MPYDPKAVEEFFDALGFGEYERHDKSPEQRIKYQLHLKCIESFVEPKSRVLEIGAGPGRFTEVLARMGCHVSVVDLSSEQLRLNRERAEEEGYASSVDLWLKADFCDLGPEVPGPFDAVVAFGGPLSYALDRRDLALKECVERLAPSGHLLLGVMSKWGTIHAFLDGVFEFTGEEIDAIVRTGDVTPETCPSASNDGHYFHMFTAGELRAFLERHGLSVRFMSASNAVTTTWSSLLEDASTFSAALALEEEAARAPGALDMGTHMIAVACRSGEGAARRGGSAG